MDHDPSMPGEIERTPAHTLDQISDGARQLLLMARERMRDVDAALDQGRFSDAYGRAQELIHKLQPLAQAESYVGAFASTFIVRAGEVHEGMILHTFGKVTSIDRHEHDSPGSDGPCVHIKLACESADEPVEFPAETELIAMRGE